MVIKSKHRGRFTRNRDAFKGNRTFMFEMLHIKIRVHNKPEKK